MFTGLIETIGRIVDVVRHADGRTLHIEAPSVMDDLAVDHSIAVNGVCLTVTGRTATQFTVTAVGETLRKTTTGGLDVGHTVNLERAVRLHDRLGGHMVQGHVDSTATIAGIDVQDQGWEVWFHYDPSFRKWLIPVGSVCIDGISLTVADLADDRLKVAVIPHTLAHTTLGQRHVGDTVNVEFDMVAKYIDNLVRHTP